jgi:hypothetical protein
MPHIETVAQRAYDLIKSGSVTCATVGKFEDFLAQVTKKEVHPTHVVVRLRVYVGHTRPFDETYAILRQFHELMCERNPVVHLGQVDGKYSNVSHPFNELGIIEVDDDADEVESTDSDSMPEWLIDALHSIKSDTHVMLTSTAHTDMIIILPKAKFDKMHDLATIPVSVACPDETKAIAGASFYRFNELFEVTHSLLDMHNELGSPDILQRDPDAEHYEACGEAMRELAKTIVAHFADPAREAEVLTARQALAEEKRRRHGQQGEAWQNQEDGGQGWRCRRWRRR